MREATQSAPPLSRAIAGDAVKPALRQKIQLSPVLEKAKTMQDFDTPQHLVDIAQRKVTGEVS